MSRLSPPDTTPSPRARSLRGQTEDLATITVKLRTMTPIFGGGSVTRELDAATPIRPSAVRGHLRYWWRQMHMQALAAGTLTSTQLYEAERALWGGPSDDKAKGGRSPVEIRITNIENKSEDDSEPPTTGRYPNHEHPTNDQRTAARNSAYALFPAAPNQGGAQREATPVAKRYKQGLTFDLSIIHRNNADDKQQLIDSISLWIAFGGIGGRTRRGLGALEIIPVHGAPQISDHLSRVQLVELCHQKLNIGLNMKKGCGKNTGFDAWIEAIGWLRDFRQGVGKAPEFARETGRPGRSRWPEADKIRKLIDPNRDWAHHIRDEYKNGGSVWPRSAFGLPIIFHFQQKDSTGNFYNPREPGDHQLVWLANAKNNQENANDLQERIRDRWASPLIIKPIKIGTKYHAVAVWINPSIYPPGKLILTNNNEPLLPSQTEFDQRLSTKDQWVYRPQGTEDRNWGNPIEVFLNWLRETGRAK